MHLVAFFLGFRVFFLLKLVAFSSCACIKLLAQSGFCASCRFFFCFCKLFFVGCCCFFFVCLHQIVGAMWMSCISLHFYLAFVRKNCLTSEPFLHVHASNCWHNLDFVRPAGFFLGFCNIILVDLVTFSSCVCMELLIQFGCIIFELYYFSPMQ